MKRTKKSSNQSQERTSATTSSPSVATARSRFFVGYTLYGLTIVVLFDWLIINWLFYEPPKYPEPLQTIAIFGMPFLMLGGLFHTQLFYWHDEAARYYERVYFVMKTLLILPGIVMSYAVSYRVLGLVDGSRVVTDPITCLYFSIVTWTTLGYGDVRPNPEARMLAASEAIVGYIVMAVFIGMFATLFHYILAKRLPGRSGLVRYDGDSEEENPN